MNKTVRTILLIAAGLILMLVGILNDSFSLSFIGILICFSPFLFYLYEHRIELAVKQKKYNKIVEERNEVNQLKTAQRETNKAATLQKKQDKLAVKCPKCKSTNLQYIERKKISIGGAIAGGVLAGDGGLVLGGISGKPKGKYKCMNCGKEFK